MPANELAIAAIALSLATVGTAAAAAEPPATFRLQDLEIAYQLSFSGPRLTSQLCDGSPSRTVVTLAGNGQLTSLDEYDGVVCEGSRRHASVATAEILETLTHLANSGFFAAAPVSGTRELHLADGQASFSIVVAPHAAHHRVSVTIGSFEHVVSCSNGAQAPCLPSFAEPLLKLAKKHFGR